MRVFIYVNQPLCSINSKRFLLFHNSFFFCILQMSLCSCSSCSTILSQRSESSNSYRLLSSSLSSITTVSIPSDNEVITVNFLFITF